jgi:hypothetical protein
MPSFVTLSAVPIVNYVDFWSTTHGSLSLPPADANRLVEALDGPVRFKAGEDTAAVRAIDRLDPEERSPLAKLRASLISDGAERGA